MHRFLLASLVLAATTPVAIAQDADRTDVDASGRPIRYADVTTVDFNDLGVTGGVVRPELVDLVETRRASFNPLVRMRDDFARELRASIDEVK